MTLYNIKSGKPFSQNTVLKQDTLVSTLKRPLELILVVARLKINTTY